VKTPPLFLQGKHRPFEGPEVIGARIDRLAVADLDGAVAGAKPALGPDAAGPGANLRAAGAKGVHGDDKRPEARAITSLIDSGKNHGWPPLACVAVEKNAFYSTDAESQLTRWESWGGNGSGRGDAVGVL